MKNVVWMMLGLLFCTVIISCSAPSGDPPARGLQNSGVESDSNKERAFTFLQGVQNGDKDKMYRAANVTPELVNESREKLIAIKQNGMPEKQRLEYEHALRISGNIDFFHAKLRKLIPQSATINITKTTPMEKGSDSSRYNHAVTITYNEKADAFSDKNGRLVKALIVNLQQIDSTVNGRPIHEFSFTSKDFDKIADKEFENVLYY